MLFGSGDAMRITLNANGQISRIQSINDDEGYSYALFAYTDRNLTQIRATYQVRSLCVAPNQIACGECGWREQIGYLNYTYSNVLNIFRYVTSPDWLLFLLGLSDFPPSRNMPSKLAIIHAPDDLYVAFTFTYQTDYAGWITSNRVVFRDYAAAWSEENSRVSRLAAPFSIAFDKPSFKSRSKTPVRKSLEPIIWEYIMTFEYILAK